MTKYIVLYSAPFSAMEQMENSTPEEREAAMATWMAWAERCGEQLVDMGAPLANGTRVSTSGTSPSEKNIVGYSVLEADNMESAQGLLEGHPHLAWDEGCNIELHESIPMGEE